jgi:hypothetical protein
MPKDIFTAYNIYQHEYEHLPTNMTRHAKIKSLYIFASICISNLPRINSKNRRAGRSGRLEIPFQAGIYAVECGTCPKGFGESLSLSLVAIARICKDTCMHA